MRALVRARRTAESTAAAVAPAQAQLVQLSASAIRFCTCDSLSWGSLGPETAGGAGTAGTSSGVMEPLPWSISASQPDLV